MPVRGRVFSVFSSLTWTSARLDLFFSTRNFKFICEGRPLRSVSANFYISRYFTSFYLSLPFLNWQDPSLPSFRPIFPSPPLILAGAGHLGPSLPLSFVPPSPISHSCTLSPLILAGAGYLGPSLPSFRPIFHLPTPYSGRGRPFGSVSALSFVPPSPIFHLCTLSPLILAGAGHLGPSLPSFRPIFPLPTPYSGRGRPFRSVSALSFVPLLPFSASAPYHPLIWQGPAI